jgi:catechol 2,3-dioxygenase-like lactoylglutathione lyase family enzyme
VSDPDRSRAFYQDLFGLTAERTPWDDEVLSSPDEGGEGFALRLVAAWDGKPDAEAWLSVEVQTVTEVLDLYLLGVMIGASATLPRRRGERWSTVIADPDGNHITIWTRVPGDLSGPPLRCSPRWEWDRARPPGFDAEGGRRDEQNDRSERSPDNQRELDRRGMAPGQDGPARERSARVN